MTKDWFRVGQLDRIRGHEFAVEQYFPNIEAAAEYRRGWTEAAIQEGIQRGASMREKQVREGTLPKLGQSQASLTEQLDILARIAVSAGLYDAHDWLLRKLDS